MHPTRTAAGLSIIDAMNARSPAAPASLDLPATADALALAQQAWSLLHTDVVQAQALADQALAQARAHGERLAEGWALLAHGHRLIYFARPRDATPQLQAALALFEPLIRSDHADTLRDAAEVGALLAKTGLARALWREGKAQAALEAALALRDEGLARLHHEQRGLLLNTIAGCYSTLGQSERAFAYMYEALRDASPTQGHGYDAVLHCNVAHELLQLGDYHEALKHTAAGLERLQGARNGRLLGVLLVNRIICLTDLQRADEALPDIERVCAMPADSSGRGSLTPYFETMAIAALQAGKVDLGRDLLQRARSTEREAILEEAVELGVAEARLQAVDGAAAAAAQALEGWWRRCENSTADDRVSLRVRGLVLQALADAHEAAGNTAAALSALRHWQALLLERGRLAARAHEQAAVLQKEVMLLQHRLEANDAERRATEQARDALAATNRALSQKFEEVEALQSALRQQALRDELTGLYNRRYLNETLPVLWAMAARNQAPLAVVIIDIDHFKLVNDEFGHDAGDRLLAGFGRLLATGLRKSDVACRWGGEEFCVLMPGTSATAALRSIEMLLERWHVESLMLGARPGAGTTFSAGVADTTQDAHEPATLLKQADDELLAAKRTGRNQVRRHVQFTLPG
jgi:diguanylate cyclase (GGDEF)-like protein